MYALLTLALALGNAAADEPWGLGELGFEVEGWCTDGDDVFVSDGEGRLLQYWKVDQGLTPVRTLATNPDVEQCLVGPDRVYFLDPALGVLAYQRSPETDPVMHAVYLAPPAGSGRFAPTAIVLQGAGSPHLRVEGAGGARAELPLPAAAAVQLPAVHAAVETRPTDGHGDAADDPVVLASANGGSAWILGADKQAGLRQYDLAGRERRLLAVGKLNNIDALSLGENRFLVAASNRTTRSIDLFHADLDTGELTPTAMLALDYEEPYGLCMALVDGVPNVFVGDKLGNLARWLIEADGSGRSVMSYRFDSLTEGCVVDRDSETLYVGEEAVGIWAVDFRSGARRLFDAVGAGYLAADVEGLDIYYGSAGRFLLASSQGDDSFAVYTLPDGQARLKFRIAADPGRGIDGVSETDGLALHAGALPGYPLGILVVQDGHNVAPAENQNFKVVDWREIEALLPGTL